MHAFPSSRLINLAAALVAGAVLVFGSAAAQASSVVARISISTQTMDVIVDGRQTHQWKVSTAGKGYRTPIGSFKPTRMHEMW